MKFIADKTVPYLKGILDSVADITYLSSEEFTPEHVRDADALIVRSIDKCTRELLQGSRVKLITSATIGFDHIDTHYCEQAGIVWRNAPGCNARSVAQYVLAGLVARSLRLGDSLQGKTMGIVGVGHVGKELEIVCHAYGMRVLRNDPPRAEIEGTDGFVSLETLAEEADIISFHTPLTREGRYPTFHLADDAFFNRLQKKPCIINAARGAIIDTSALLKASQSGRVGDLIIDCWEGEPHINRLLLQQAYIATPHIAGFSADGKANGTRACLEQIASFFQLDIPKLSDVQPPLPEQPLIDLNRFSGQRVEQAILSCFNPLDVDRRLRETPERFEWFRANYHYPREFQAYTIANATPQEADLLRQLGFQIQNKQQ